MASIVCKEVSLLSRYFPTASPACLAAFAGVSAAPSPPAVAAVAQPLLPPAAARRPPPPPPAVAVTSTARLAVPRPRPPALHQAAALHWLSSAGGAP